MNISHQLEQYGYIARRREALALEAAIAQPAGSGLRSLLLEGPPGAGKTALGEAAAKVMDARLVYALMHAWTDSDELFSGVDVAAAVGGDAARVRQDGVLALAARASIEGPVVVLLDEVDKTSERAECLLLDWLQSGRVPVAPGHHLTTRGEHVLVVMTSNGVRPLSDALMRRVRRVRMDPMPVETMDKIAAERSGAPRGVVKIASKAAREIAAADQAYLSVQELSLICADLMAHATSVEDVREILAQLAARGDAGHKLATSCPLAPAIWSEVRRGH